MLFGLLAFLLAAYIAQRATLIARWRKGDRGAIDPVRRFNRRWTNPTAMKYLRAGKRWSPYALVHHTGRRSGRAYTTPVITTRVPGGFLIPLAYGDTVDWYRNLSAAGGGRLEWQGTTHPIGAPAIRHASAAVGAFPLVWQIPLRLYGIAQFIWIPRLELDTKETAIPRHTEAAVMSEIPEMPETPEASEIRG
jgi:deazaflavin-dependent oxidoreductase (nitroreductase family)